MHRVCFQLQVRTDRLDEYRRRHAAVWPEMLEALHQAGWRNYSLFLRPDGLLIGYFETDSAEAAVERVQRSPVNSRWQTEMAEFFENLGDRTPDLGFVVLDEIFNLDDQRDRNDNATELDPT
ncbi:MAG: L-rhamnose mutarotase [Propionibacteriales bacterium]|nr:L-rhamnose mutarotase [Propionibacteriales bacterium]